MTQLTGFSDPVYAEAYININQYDIVLDVLVVNQTADTLQACSLELATLGMYYSCIVLLSDCWKYSTFLITDVKHAPIYHVTLFSQLRLS